MADLGYTSHLSLPAAEMVAGLPRRKQRRVLDLADQLAIQPFEIGDYRSEDAVGHTVENLLIDGFLFTYWIDHAVREVRITEIIKV
jgi:hypothetical protein